MAAGGDGATVLRVEGEQTDTDDGDAAVLQPQCPAARKNSRRGFTAQALRAEARAAKWGHVWLRKVFPEGTEWQRANDLEGKCPVRIIFLHGDQEYNQVLGPCDLHQLQPGASFLPANIVPASRSPSLLSPLHPAFPKDCWYLPAQIQHWSNNLNDFMTIGFSRPTRVFILLPSLAQEPRWLRPLFFKLRDPNLQEVHLKMKWRTMLATRWTLGITGLLEQWRQQTLRVFKSKKVYHPGEQLVLGGMGLATIVEVGYAVAFRQEYSEFRDRDAAEADTRSGQLSNPGIQFGLRELVDLETWLQRLIKVVKRGRLVEARLLIETDLARPREQSLLAQHDINVLPEGEPHVLLVDLAAANKDVKMVCLLVDRCNCVLSYKALQLIVRQWEEVPALSGTALGLLIKYLLNHPNPLAIVSAYLMAIRAEVVHRFKVRPTAQLEEALAKLQQVQLLLLRRSQEVVRDSQVEQHQQVQQLEAILDPKYNLASASSGLEAAGPNGSSNSTLGPAFMTISCFKPLRVAMHDKDADFMNAPVVELFNRCVWQGREYVMETCKDGQHSLSLLDPSIMANVFINMGFANAHMKVMDLSARLWHLSTYSQQAFFNSPRARWIMRCLSSITFIILYLQVVGANLIPNWFHAGADTSDFSNLSEDVVRGMTINVALFDCWIFGNVVEVTQMLFLRYRKNPAAWVTSHGLEIFFLIIDLLLISVSAVYALFINKAVDLDTYTLTCLIMTWAVAAPLLWGQTLLPLIPLMDNLGPMLGTLRAMLEQLATFVIPWSLITAGFAVSLNVVYQTIKIPELSDFWSTTLFLFRGYANGGPDYDVLYSALDDLDGVLDDQTLKAFRLYGTIIFIVYTVVSTIILGNLLIAIITNSYRPDSVRAQSKLSFAAYVDMHQFQVEHHLLCTPFNLVPLLLWFLPAGKRLKVHPTRFYGMALAFLDGFVPASPNDPHLPVGRAEIPHLIYLLIIPPMAASASLVLFVIHIPFSAIYFAAVGHRRVVNAMQSMTSSFGNDSGSKRPSRSQVASGVVSRDPSVSRRGSQSSDDFNRASTSVTASNDEYGVFGPDDAEAAKAAQQSPLLRLWNAVARFVVFTFWLTFGFVTLLTFIVLETLHTLYVMVAAICWSLYHIVWGSIRLWGQGCRRLVAGLRSDCAVHPDTSASSRRAQLNFEEQQVQRANMVKDMEDRYKHFSLFTNHDVRECLQAVFGYTYGLGDPEEATRRADQPPPLDRAKMGFRQAGVMSMAAHMLSDSSLHPRSKSAVRVAADVAAIAKAFIKPSAGDGKSAQPAGGQGDEVTAWVEQGDAALEASGLSETGGAQTQEAASDKLLPSSKAAGQTFGEAKVRDARDAASDRPGSAATSVESRQPRGVSWHGIRSRRGSGGDGLEEGASSTRGEVQELRQAVAEMSSQLQQMSKLLGALVEKNEPQSARAPAAMLDD